MVHWVYILECDDKYVYVGETIHLYSRFRQHVSGRGGFNTGTHTPNKLVGLYKVSANSAFVKYRDALLSGEYNPSILREWYEGGNNLLVENRITERLFYERRENTKYGCGNEWYKVRGGKYTKSSLDEIVMQYRWASEKEGRTCWVRNPISDIPEKTIVDRPLCKCMYPSEVRLSKDGTKIYFVCAMRNIWDEFSTYLAYNSPCDFWKLFMEDNDITSTYNTKDKCIIRL
jgi:hypothetical protein